jgi:hypothetical protein
VTEYETPTHVFFRTNRLTDEAAGVLKILDIEPPKQILVVRALG